MNIFRGISYYFKVKKKMKLEAKMSAARMTARFSELIGRSVKEISDGIRLITWFGYAYINQGYKWTEASRFIQNCKIYFAWYEKGTGKLHLYLGRPGVFIGVKGKDLMAIENYIKQYASNYSDFTGITLHEYIDPVENALYLFEYAFRSDL